MASRQLYRLDIFPCLIFGAFKGVLGEDFSCECEWDLDVKILWILVRTTEEFQGTCLRHCWSSFCWELFEFLE